jgi:hypothetical protein
VKVELPKEFIEQVAQRAAALVLAQLNGQHAAQWPHWMRLPTAAKYLDLTDAALRKRAERGELSYSQEGPGCALWFARADLDSFMFEQRHEARRSSL